MIQHKNVPKLRFKEFNDEWHKTDLRSVLLIGSGRDYKHLGSGNIPVFGTGGYMASVNDNLYDGETVLIGRKGTINKPFYYNGKFWTVDTLFYTHGFKEVTPKFISYIFQQMNWLKYNEASGVPSLSKSTLEKIKIKIPKIQEQEKISDFLTTIDSRISRLNLKVNLLQKFKKAIMKKIFSQEIIVNDKNGKSFSKWEIKPLSKIANKVDLRNIDNSCKIVLTNSAIKGVVIQNDFFNKEIANQNNLKNYFVVQKDDFIYNPRISNFAPVGPIKRSRIDKGLVSPLYSVFRFKEGNLDFFEHYFETSLWHKYIKSVANYGARFDRISITNSNLFNLPMPCPDIAEQDKIANFLKLITKKLTLAKNELRVTKKFKKGLQQQMFV